MTAEDIELDELNRIIKKANKVLSKIFHYMPKIHRFKGRYMKNLILFY